LFVSTAVDGSAETSLVWLLTFSVIIVSNFTQTVFVAERLNGSCEILLTCGLSRDAILFGKTLFVAGISTVMGYLCMALASLWIYVMSFYGIVPALTFGPGDLLLFAVAACFNSSAASVLSIYLPNPRMSHFVNFLIMALVAAAFFAARRFFPLSPAVLCCFLLAVSGACMVMARHGFSGERAARRVTI